MKRECLEKLTVKELRNLPEAKIVKGRHDMKKADLIEAILVVKGGVNELTEMLTRTVGEKEFVADEATLKSFEEEIAADAVGVEWEDKVAPFSVPVPKSEYIDNAKIDNIIAFKVNETKVLSGKILEIHKDQFIVETKTKVKFAVKKRNVIWVKTGLRWPKGVYLALKGGDINAYQSSGERG